MSVKVYDNTEVYAELVMSDGANTKFYYFPDTGSAASIIELISSFDLKGRGVLRVKDASGATYGASLQSLVSVKPITYSEAKGGNILKYSPYTYEEVTVPDLTKQN